jgi:hypothetical protein
MITARHPGLALLKRKVDELSMAGEVMRELDRVLVHVRFRAAHKCRHVESPEVRIRVLNATFG